MYISEYFEARQGMAVFSTAGRDGLVGSALFSRPYFLEDGSVAFVMLERLDYKNLQENANATYLFVENGPGYKGLRLQLKKTGELDDPQLIERLIGRKLCAEEDKTRGPRHLVTFSVAKILPLVGGGEQNSRDINT